MTELDKKVDNKEQYTLLKAGETPISGNFEGKEDDFGKSGKSYKFYVNGVDLTGKEQVIDIPVKTPKNRHMVKFIFLASKMQKMRDIYDNDVDFLDQILDYIEKYYDVPVTFLDRIEPMELLTLIGFVSVISVSPSRDQGQK